MKSPAHRDDEVIGDPIPPKCEIIEIRMAEIQQVFNRMDPSPFQEKDLDPRAEEFIVGWAREASRNAPLALSVHLDHTNNPQEEAEVLRESIQEFFSNRALVSRRKLRQLFRVGRTSLVVGLMFLAACVVAGEVVAKAMDGSRLGEILRERILIGGWVAMWRPLEIFLCDWWPIRDEARLYDRLGAMPVWIKHPSNTKGDR